MMNLSFGDHKSWLFTWPNAKCIPRKGEYVQHDGSEYTVRMVIHLNVDTIQIIVEGTK